MTNRTSHLAHFRSRCQAGLPVWFDHRPDGTTLRQGTSTNPLPAVPLLYARLDRPTGRLLLHYVISPGRVKSVMLENETLTVPRRCTISNSVSRLLHISPEKRLLRKGRHPLLNDGHFLTASVGVVSAHQGLEITAVYPRGAYRKQNA